MASKTVIKDLSSEGLPEDGVQGVWTNGISCFVRKTDF